jgi:hypothetical protein
MDAADRSQGDALAVSQRRAVRVALRVNKGVAPSVDIERHHLDVGVEAIPTSSNARGKGSPRQMRICRGDPFRQLAMIGFSFVTGLDQSRGPATRSLR